MWSTHSPLIKSACWFGLTDGVFLWQEIAETKMPDLNAVTIEAAMKIVAGTAKNMGITVEEPVAA